MKKITWIQLLIIVSALFLVSAGFAQGNDKIVWLSSLDMSKMSQGAGKPKIDKNSDVKSLSISKQIFLRGVGTQVKSYLWLDLGGGSEKFSAYVGIDDDTTKEAYRTSHNFKILGDGKKLWESGTMHYGDKAKKAEVNLKGINTLILVVINTSNRTSYIQADWADASFVVNGQDPKTIDPPTEAAVILTPKPGKAPKINGPNIFGCRPNNFFLYRIPATGERPMLFAAENLPPGLILDPQTGIITGSVKNNGEYIVTLKTKNTKGSDSRQFKIICGNTIALTPTMGWNTWYAYYGNISDKLMRDAADSIMSNGMADVGYQYVDIDDCWSYAEKSTAISRVGAPRDTNGNIRPNKSLFPDMKRMVDYIHSKGLRAGIYTSPGPTTCAGYAGSYNHEEQDAKQFADWGFDLLKYDWCSYSKIDNSITDIARQKPYRIMGTILQHQNRDIVFNLCQYGMNEVWKWGEEVGGNSWRTGGDLTHLNKIFEIALKNAEHGAFVKPGAWNDPDYIQIGYVGNTPTKLTPNEQYSFMSLWCLLATPLVYSGSLNKMDDFTLSILCNPEVIEIDQDALGKPAKVFPKSDESFLMVKEMEDGSKAIGLCNSGEIPVSVTIDFSEIGLTGKQVIRDLWRQKNLGTFRNRFTTDVPRHGVVLVRIIKPSLSQQTTKSRKGNAKWTIATLDTRLTVGATDKGQLCIYSLSNPSLAWNWTAKPSVFALMDKVSINGKIHDIQWKYKDGVMDKKDGQKLTIRFVCDQPAMELKSVWHARSGHGPVRHTMFICNNSNSQVTIYEQETFDLYVAGPPTDASVNYISDDGTNPDKIGVYHDPLVKGYQKTLKISDKQDFIPYIVVDAAGKSGLYMGWEWSIGRINIAVNDTFHGAHLMAGNRDDFRTDLAAGEIFQVPPGFIGAFKGDMDDAGNNLHKYLFNYSMPAQLRKNPGYPKVEWNAFAATGKGQGSWHPTEIKFYPFIDDIAPLGFEEVVIDIGWWSSYGDPSHIVTDPVSWPSGMAKASKYAHDHGIRFGLYDNESEYLTSDSGKSERVRDISYLLTDLKADFYRSDCTAGPILKGGHGTGQRAHYPEDEGYWATKGFYDVLDTLYATFPSFLWENCCGGGRIKDFGAARRASKIQNQDRYYPIDARQSFYDASYAIHPMQIAALDGSWAKWQASGSVFEFRSSSMGAAYWHPDAPNGGNGGPVWSAQQKADIKKAVATYKNRIRPLVRNADLYHIFPRPDDKHWDGIEYYDPNTGKGVVYIFKPAAGTDTMKIKLRGLESKKTYHITFDDGSNPAIFKTGKELGEGINVTLKDTLASELMFIDAAKLPIKVKAGAYGFRYLNVHQQGN